MNTLLVKALPARRYVGWYGYYRGDSRLEFNRIVNRADLPILYKTKEAALEQAAEHARIDVRSYAGVFPS